MFGAYLEMLPHYHSKLKHAQQAVDSRGKDESTILRFVFTYMVYTL